MTQTDFYIKENERNEFQKEILSPSGKFKLLIRMYGTKPGCWNYSRGTVYNIENNEEVCDIKRNYSTFHHGFITKNNQEWLISGRCYMSQTIVNLETKKEYSPKNNDEFCWAGPYLLSPDEKTLVVGGCYWAAPYEYKLFDFSNPEEGWPELIIEHDEYLTLDSYKYPIFTNNVMTFYKTSRIYMPLNKDEDYLTPEEFDSIKDADFKNKENWKIEENVRLSYKREENGLILVEKWISEEEKSRREQAEINRKAWEKQLLEFKTKDPLYLEFKRLLSTLNLPVEEWESHGITYKDWCPNFKETETRWCKRIVNSTSITVDLEWAIKTGPIKLILYKDGKHLENKFFEHSVIEMQNAFNYAISFLNSPAVN